MTTAHPNLPVGVDYTQVFALAARMQSKAARLPGQARRVLRRSGLLLETRIKANASGRPGPRARSGDYRRSWSTSPVRQEGAEQNVTVGTSAPQASRLEHGFVGVDVLGRHYNQPPFPHVAPAVAVVRPEFVEAMRRIGATLEDS